MSRLAGVGVSPGVGFGTGYVLAHEIPVPAPGSRHGGDAGTERSRAEDALEQVAADLEERGARAGGEGQQVLNAQAMMARDPGLAEEVAELIAEGRSASRAVYEGFGRYREILVDAGGYLGARVADLDDVRDRVIAVLEGVALPGVPVGAAEPYVLVARDLAPADTALLSPGVVAAFVTEEGGPTSHTAIIARTLGVPAVVACPGAASIPTGTPVLVDGTSGLVRLSPSGEEVDIARKAAAARAVVLAAGTGPGATADGHAVPLLANIGGPGEVDAALEHGAEGVGLYRTEFLFLGRKEAPSPQEQEAAYLEVLRAFPGGQVVVRTLDAGADKPLAFLPPAGEEPNPALGERGSRLFRIHPELMTGQLTALARAASQASARVRVMAPMVATAEEAARFAAACREAGLPSAGVMIEIPSAALRASDLAAEVAFFSIGTNDLAQYAFAADRQVGALTTLQDAWQPALLDLVAMAAAGAARHGRPCGVCGEAAADPVLACVLVGLGVTSLSMAPPSLPAVRAVLARHTQQQCVLAGQAARRAVSPAQARAAAREHLPGLTDLAL
ncbi:phosphoenolpyruvate-protein phosphotransferase [Planobispora rosea]|uniref:Phosphoenolpyruvate-protein phosphotransferase n=1 Tax=Planobispora rosea TaxID=35762 RepID=A0A8J3S4U4_PLARO|nr:phosphoenolpyruvate--protein phosphotransferase [Planobispora rosea]GGS79367.1 phosphoenolpyruvate-protein phosphotransferase [Planobispora rosea]GIH85887.1 phosphoenolpyruvate-protein phosphotransferase [Planobispora rosea]